MSDYEVLNKINSPADVKKLNAAERKELAAEMRAPILLTRFKIAARISAASTLRSAAFNFLTSAGEIILFRTS